MTASDELCLKFLADSGHLAGAEAYGVSLWWQAERQCDEDIVAFLVRRGVFFPWAAEELELIDRGQTGSSTFSHLFTPKALPIIKRRASAVPADSATTMQARDTIRTSSLAPTKPAVDSALLAKRRALAERVKAALPPPDTKPLADLNQETQVNVPRPVQATPAAPPPPSIRSSQSADAFTYSSELIAGTTLGAYQLQICLGRGPKGLVFVADDVLLGRPVAVKVLAPEMAVRGQVWTKRFIQEARLASQLEHPLILSMFAIGQERGLVFYAMPLMRGGSIKDALKKAGPFTPPEATRIARQIAGALTVAHKRGLSHGNLKPSNVFLSEGGAVRIADFTVPHLPLNETGLPALREQDVATDLRLLAALYHWLLTGKPPSAATGSINAVAPSAPTICTQLICRSLSRSVGQCCRMPRRFPGLSPRWRKPCAAWKP